MNAGYSKLGCSALLQCMHCLPLSGSCTGGTDLARLYGFKRKDIRTKARTCNSVSLLPNLRLLLLIPAPTLVTSLKWTEEEVSAANWICWHESNTQVLLLEMEESCHLKLRSWEHYCNTVQKSSRKKRPQYYCTVSNIKVLDSVRMLLDTQWYQAGS